MLRLRNPRHVRQLWAMALAAGAVASPLRAEQPYESYYRYLGEYPAEANPGFHEDVQGVTHDLNNWFITQTATVWKIPVSNSLIEVSGSDSGVLVRTFLNYPALLGVYDHFGDASYFEYAGVGYVVVATTGPGQPAAFVFFRASDLAYVGRAAVPGETDIGWCGIDPQGNLYTSESQASTILKHTFDWAELHAQGTFDLRFDEEIALRNSGGGGLTLHYMQGGVFSPSGDRLYIVSGFYTDTNPDTEGIHVFDTSTWRRVEKSTNGYGLFNYEFHPTFDEAEEPEGLTYWDLDDGRAPGIRGQLHVFMLDNDLGSDEVYFKHYTGFVHVNQAAPLLIEDGTLGFPFDTIAEGYNFAWAGAVLNIQSAAYNETITMNKAVELVARNGMVTIGN